MISLITQFTNILDLSYYFINIVDLYSKLKCAEAFHDKPRSCWKCC